MNYRETKWIVRNPQINEIERNYVLPPVPIPALLADSREPDPIEAKKGEILWYIQSEEAGSFVGCRLTLLTVYEAHQSDEWTVLRQKVSIQKGQTYYQYRYSVTSNLGYMKVNKFLGLLESFRTEDRSDIILTNKFYKFPIAGGKKLDERDFKRLNPCKREGILYHMVTDIVACSKKFCPDLWFRQKKSA